VVAIDLATTARDVHAGADVKGTQPDQGLRESTAHPNDTSAGRPMPAMEENMRAIMSWEQAALHSRSPSERLSEWITSTAAGGPVLFAHVAWFSLWAMANTGMIPGVAPFDRFPFPLLTTTVSLEAIFLALFVLASQNRLAKQADKRAHLDLQIDLLAEREMTAVLQLLQDIAAHLDVKGTVTSAQIRELMKKTDIHEVAAKLDEMHDQSAGDGGSAPNGEGGRQSM
jgi:uncharacterized membrane protein